MRSRSISTSREREEPARSTPTGSDASAEKDREAPRLSRSSAISSLVCRSVPLVSSPAVIEARSLRPGGAKRGPPWSEPDTATVGLKWFSRTSNSAPFWSTRRETASSNGTRPWTETPPPAEVVIRRCPARGFPDPRGPAEEPAPRHAPASAERGRRSGRHHADRLPPRGGRLPAPHARSAPDELS